ncbi:MAG: dTMP kinase, partial [Deltaproteobacteria bacterium]|nr:dTMP kinase [Deltaproteobacteria bacterium]
MRPGFLLALEGLDGAGKTTLAFQIQEKLLALGLTALVFKEPTLGPMGLIIRQLTGAGRPDWLTPNQELELFLADRAWDVDNNIRPALQTGAVAILDRYILSSVVYQGALGLDPNYILTKN